MGRDAALSRNPLHSLAINNTGGTERHGPRIEGFVVLAQLRKHFGKNERARQQ